MASKPVRAVAWLALGLAATSGGTEFSVTTETEFRTALVAASTNSEDDTISLPAGTIAVSGGPLAFQPGATWEGFGTDNHSLLIQGAGAGLTALDGRGATRLLRIVNQLPLADGTPVQITLRGIRFCNGAGDFESGAVWAYADSVDLAVEDSEFVNNQAQSCDGGALALQSAGGTVTVRQCRFSGNSCQGNGGGAFLRARSVLLRESRFEGNRASRGGGAQVQAGTGGNALVERNVFTGNRAFEGGGLGGEVEGTTDILNNLAVGNAAGLGYSSGGTGAGMYIAAGGAISIALAGNTVSRNLGRYDSGVRLTGSADGAVVAHIYNNILWDNLYTFLPGLTNLSLTTHGGAVNVYNNDIGPADEFWPSPNINLDPRFVDPGSWNDNGTPGDPADDVWTIGDYHLQGGSPCVDRGTHSVPTPPGLPLVDLDGDPRVLNGTVDIGADEFSISGPPALTVDPLAHDFGSVRIGTAASRDFVVLNQGGEDLLIRTVTLAGADAGDFGKASSCGVVPSQGSCTLSITFRPSSTGPKAAALEIGSNDPVAPTTSIPLAGSGKVCDVFRVDFANGHDGNDGTAWDRALRSIDAAIGLAVDGDEVWVMGGSYYVGFASSGILVDKAVGIYGGFTGSEQHREERDWVLHETLIDANLWAQRCFHITASATLDGLTIARGNAPNYPSFPDNAGGGVYVSGGASPVLANCRVIENQADFGAGIYNEGAGLTLRNCVVSGNYAHELGGGIYNASAMDMVSTTVTGNNSDGDGGGILNDAQLLVIGSVVSSNTGLSGGGICSRDLPGTALTMVRTSVRANSADWSGGGVCATGGAVRVMNSVFSSNAAVSYRGGGVEGHGEFTNCVFAGNAASGTGGGFYSPGTLYAACLTNCTLVGNGAAQGGGVATGLGDRPLPPRVTNCILMTNTASGSGPQVYPSATVVQYCDVDQEGYAGTNGNIRADPKFIDLARGDHHLRALSPCIDAGDSGAVPADRMDLDGDGDTAERVPRDMADKTRFFDGPGTDTGSGPPPLVDMGAYEYVGDDDEDGISDEDEMGPGGDNPTYDGNSDGLPDRLQANVASLHTAVGQGYATVAVPAGCVLSGVTSEANPSPADVPPGVDFPYGFLGFDITGLVPGSATTATLYLPAGYALVTYYRYGAEPGDPTPHWYEFMDDGTTGAVITGSVVALHFVDGQRGDDDLAANSMIVDPGAPGRLTAGLPANLTGQWSDLSGTAVKPPRKYLVQGTLTIRNNGFSPVGAKAKIVVYLSTDTVVNKGDRKLASLTVATLDPGSTLTFAISKRVSGAPSGKHVLAVLDATGKVAEGDETDNLVLGTIP